MAGGWVWVFLVLCWFFFFSFTLYFPASEPDSATTKEWAERGRLTGAFQAATEPEGEPPVAPLGVIRTGGPEPAARGAAAERCLEEGGGGSRTTQNRGRKPQGVLGAAVKKPEGVDVIGRLLELWARY